MICSQKQKSTDYKALKKELHKEYEELRYRCSEIFNFTESQIESIKEKFKKAQEETLKKKVQIETSTNKKQTFIAD